MPQLLRILGGDWSDMRRGFSLNFGEGYGHMGWRRPNPLPSFFKSAISSKCVCEFLA